MDNNKKVENEVPVAHFTAFSKLTLRLFNDNTFDALEAISYDSDEEEKFISEHGVKPTTSTDLIS